MTKCEIFELYTFIQNISSYVAWDGRKIPRGENPRLFRDDFRSNDFDFDCESGDIDDVAYERGDELGRGGEQGRRERKGNGWGRENEGCAWEERPNGRRNHGTETVAEGARETADGVAITNNGVQGKEMKKIEAEERASCDLDFDLDEFRGLESFEGASDDHGRVGTNFYSAIHYLDADSDYEGSSSEYDGDRYLPDGTREREQRSHSGAGREDGDADGNRDGCDCRSYGCADADENDNVTLGVGRGRVGSLCTGQPRIGSPYRRREMERGRERERGRDGAGERVEGQRSAVFGDRVRERERITASERMIEEYKVGERRAEATARERGRERRNAGGQLGSSPPNRAPVGVPVASIPVAMLILDVDNDVDIRSDFDDDCEKCMIDAAEAATLLPLSPLSPSSPTPVLAVSSAALAPASAETDLNIGTAASSLLPSSSSSSFASSSSHLPSAASSSPPTSIFSDYPSSVRLSVLPLSESETHTLSLTRASTSGQDSVLLGDEDIDSNADEDCELEGAICNKNDQEEELVEEEKEVEVEEAKKEEGLHRVQERYSHSTSSNRIPILPNGRTRITVQTQDLGSTSRGRYFVINYLFAIAAILLAFSYYRNYPNIADDNGLGRIFREESISNFGGDRNFDIFQQREMRTEILPSAFIDQTLNAHQQSLYEPADQPDSEVSYNFADTDGAESYTQLYGNIDEGFSMHEANMEIGTDDVDIDNDDVDDGNDIGFDFDREESAVIMTALDDDQSTPSPLIRSTPVSMIQHSDFDIADQTITMAPSSEPIPHTNRDDIGIEENVNVNESQKNEENENFATENEHDSIDNSPSNSLSILDGETVSQHRRTILSANTSRQRNRILAALSALLRSFENVHDSDTL